MHQFKWLALVLIAVAGAGCTSSHGQIYRSGDWKNGQSLGKVLLIVPKYRTESGEERPDRDEKIRLAIRSSFEQMAGVSVMDGEADGPMSEAEAISAGVKQGARTVCLVTVGQFGGRYLLTVLPPGWDSRTTVQYAVRVIDVESGALLVDSVRERSSGGYLAIMTATYPADLANDLTCVLSAQP
jgi:hypothetical protein